MENRKLHQISVKLDSSEPISVSKEKFKSKPPLFKRYQRIEEVAGRPVEEILLENIQLKNRRNDMGVQIEKLNKTIDDVTSVLHQLLDIELTLNPKLARPIADEFQVNKHNEYANEKVNDVEAVAHALRKIRYYYHPSVEEWVQSVERAKSQSVAFYERNVKLKEENQALKDELDELKEKQQQSIRKLAGKGIRILVNDKETEANYAETESPKEEMVESVDEAVSQETEDKIEQEVTAKEPVAEKQVEEKKEEPVVVAQEKKVKVLQRSAPREQNITYYQPEKSDDEMIEEIQRPKFKMILDKKGYDYKDSEQPPFHLMIKDKGNEVPLVYIDYEVNKADEFDEMMKKTDQIYFLFDTKENMKTGNIKFGSWLMKNAKEKRKTIEFSFTTVDELKNSGLDDLGKLGG